MWNVVVRSALYVGARLPKWNNVTLAILKPASHLPCRFNEDAGLSYAVWE